MFDFIHPEPSWKRGDDRRFTPARPVWVNLARLYPRPTEVRPFPEGWDLQAVVPGEQTAWLKTTTGDWVAEVRYSVRRGDGGGGVPHTAWVPADAVQLRQDAPARKGHKH
ncbi:hypothetical protein [Saccharopolyspora tripterygii]